MKKELKWYQILLRILLVLYVIIYLPLGLFIGTIAFKANKNPDKIPDFFGHKPMIVLSGSMETKIMAGDLAIVKMIDPKLLKQNDIIAFRTEDNTVTLHRIVKIINEDSTLKFQTKGDANNTNDQNLVLAKDVEGIYIKKIDNMGHVFMAVQKPIFMYITLTIGVVIITALFVIDYTKTKRKMNDKEYEEYLRLKEKEGKK